MRDERRWQPVEVIWDEEVRAPASPPFPTFRGQPFPIATPPPDDRPRAPRQATEYRERRDDGPSTRRGRGKSKAGRKKLRAQDFAEFDEA